jgi:hypothetical protein
MRVRKQPRKLVGLVIDDEAARLNTEKLAPFVTIKQVNSYRAAQRLLLDSASKSDLSGDLFLIDVNFEKSSVPEGLDWGGQSEVKPFGPILALPFLGREVCSFVPYSSYWGDDSVKKNGFVLVAISLLLAATKRERYTLDEVNELISDSVNAEGSNLLSTAGAALNDALDQFRVTLGTSKRIRFIDVGRTKKRLIELQESCTEDTPLPIPLRDDEGVLSIDFSYPPYFTDSIELSSLFADVLRFRGPTDQLILEGIHEILDMWSEKSDETGGYILPEAAKRALARAEGSSDDDGSQIPIKAAVELELSTSTVLNKHAVIRTAMLFAWVQAWYDYLTNIDREREALDVSLISSVWTALGLGSIKDPAISYRRLLCTTRHNNDVVSDKPWRTPFKSNYSSTNDAYQLDIDEPSLVSPLQKAMCIQYAIDELRWDGSNPSYPRWMIEM